MFDLNDEIQFVIDWFHIALQVQWISPKRPGKRPLLSARFHMASTQTGPTHHPKTVIGTFSTLSDNELTKRTDE